MTDRSAQIRDSRPERRDVVLWIPVLAGPLAWVLTEQLSYMLAPTACWQGSFLILGLGEFRCVPWHTHDEVTDTFFCIEGPMRVEVSDPDHTYVLLAGQTCEVPARRPHFVSGTSGNPCVFLVMQGIGQYNYVPVEHV